MFSLTVADVFFIHGRGLVATGQVEAGSVRIGDQVLVNGARQVRIEGIEAFRKKLDTASAGDNVGLLLRDVDKDDVKAGDVLTSEAGATPQADPGWSEKDFPGGLPR
ncbi:MAG: hypothetical protein QOI80_279 [Solirubrobacteraceae bacterium]|nr:hypothetical protein [Solirubrobacteraceae bacterium]